jgi:DNA polymerase III delta subunit
MEGKLYLICGDDDYLVDSAARERLDRLVPESDRAFGIETVDGRKESSDEIRKAVDACMESVQTPGFFGAGKVTWFRDVAFLTGAGRVSETLAAKEAVEKLTRWLKGGLLEGQTLVITAPRVLRTSVFFKTCQTQGEIQDFGGGFKTWELEKLAGQRVDALFAQAGLTVDPAARAEFLKRAGFDTRFLVNEVEKLRLYVGGRATVTAEDVREITSIGREAEAWDLLDAFGERDALGALTTLKRLSGQKGIGVMLAAMLEKAVRDLLILREAHDRKWAYGGKGGACGWNANLPPEAAPLLEALPVNPRSMNAWAMKKKLPHALNYTLQELRVARHRILDLREKLVSCSLPEMFLLETTLLRIIGNNHSKAPAPRPAAAGAR